METYSYSGTLEISGAEPTNMVVSWDLTKWAQLESDVSGKCWKTMQAWRIDQDL